VEDISIDNWKIKFETEFQEKMIKDLIAGSRIGVPLETLIARGARYGKTEAFAGNIYSVPNFEEWLTGPFDELYAVASLGTCLQLKKGGLESYIKVKNSMLPEPTEKKKAE